MSKAFDFARSIEGSGSFDGLALPSSTSSTAGVAGEIRNNNGTIERWSATDFVPRWRPIDEDAQPNPLINYLVIGGGGGGGAAHQGGGGGAGGYRTSWGTGNVSGGLSPAETALTISLNTAYTLTVGAGGSGGSAASPGATVNTAGWGGRGGDSTFASITSFGGGGGGTYHGGVANAVPNNQGSVGSSGGAPNVGSAVAVPANAATSTQGFRGGNRGAINHANDFCGSGGGGAGGQGEDQLVLPQVPRDGGVGLESNITGTATYRGGGGGGGRYYNSGTIAGLGANEIGLGGQGGGGNGGHEANGITPTAGTANTGGGGGGGGYTTNNHGAAGGSGIIILRGLSGLIATFSAGVTVNGTTTSSSQAVAGTTVGNDLVWVVTAASGDTVTFST